MSAMSRKLVAVRDSSWNPSSLHYSSPLVELPSFILLPLLDTLMESIIPKNKPRNSSTRSTTTLSGKRLRSLSLLLFGSYPLIGAFSTSVSEKTTTVDVRQHFDPDSQRTYTGLNTDETKFRAFLRYSQVPEPYAIRNFQSNETKQFRKDWQNQTLVTERTELLQDHQRCNFTALLLAYTERLREILQDEREEDTAANQTTASLLLWLEREYEHFDRLEDLHDGSNPIPILQQFLDWFKGSFPYYYDRCAHCGASYKEDTNSEDHLTFVGYIAPNETEKFGKASRVELFQCHNCHAFTRFPRYNSISHILQLQQGRCGEYSILMFRIFRALRHRVRWVVDWSDHVWIEVFLQNRWIHLDPCEAAVDENYLYQSWGKSQVYILGFTESSITDITKSYTTLSLPEIQAQRDEPEDTIRTSIRRAVRLLNSSPPER